MHFPSKVSLVFALAEEMLGNILASAGEATVESKSFAEAIRAGVFTALEEMGHNREVLTIVRSGASLASSPAD